MDLRGNAGRRTGARIDLPRELRNPHEGCVMEVGIEDAVRWMNALASIGSSIRARKPCGGNSLSMRDSCHAAAFNPDDFE